MTQPPPAPVQLEPTEEQIATRAYEIWQRRGCPIGNDTQGDWFAARAELAQEHKSE